MEKPVSDKSDGAFRTISEVADDLDLPQHVLRFWETRFPQIRPLKRAGGRRFYRPVDVDLLRDIRALLYGEGYTIKGVQRLLRERGVRGLRDGSPDDRAGDEPLRAGAADESGGDPPPPSPEPEGGGPASLRQALALIEDCERRLRAALLPGD